MMEICAIVIVIGCFSLMISVILDEPIGAFVGTLLILGGMLVLVFLPWDEPSIESEQQRKQELQQELNELKQNRALYELRQENDRLEDSIYKIKNGL